MADPRISKLDERFTEDEIKAMMTFKAPPGSVCKHPCCDEGENCLPCNASYHPQDRQLQLAQYSYRHRFTDEEAQVISSKLVSQIQGDRRHISARLERHADIVMSRWTKNGTFGSQQKRENLLSKVAADMAKTPKDIVEYHYEPIKGPCTNRPLARRHMLLLPWLNSEMLKTSPEALLSLLHCRSAYGPSEWAAFDGEQFKRYWANGHFECDFSSKTIVMFGEQEYGSLVDWEAEEIHRGDTVGFPFGLLVLEAQAYLMGVLHKALDAILQGIDDSHPTRTEKWQQATATGTFRRTNGTEPWSSYTRGAFCAPPKFDLAYWTSLTQSRREKAEDHLRALQCDPAYMRRYIRVVADSARWTRFSAEAKGTWFTAKLYDAVDSYYLWRFMEDECRHVDEVCRRHGDDGCTRGRPLPQEVDRALSNFNNWLVYAVASHTRGLFENLSMAPAFSKHWDAKPESDGFISYSRITGHDSMVALEEDPLDWYLCRIAMDSGTSRLFDHSRLFSFLEDYLSSSKVGETRRVDELMVAVIDDLAAMHEMANAARLRRPMSSIISKEAMRRSLGRRATSRPYTPPKMDHRFNRICKESSPRLLKAYQQSRPPQGLKGQAWIDQQKELRSSLSSFWDSVRESKKWDLSKSDLAAEEVEDLLKVISADLSSEHQKTVKDEEDAVYAGMKKRREALTTATTVIFTGEEERLQTPKREVPCVKNKKKTRPDTPADVRAEEPPIDLSNLSLKDEAPCEAIVVTRKTFDEFVCKVFPAERTEGKQGLDWQAFVRGMTAVGCSVTNSGGGGSEVLFSHGSFGKITFHRPHPEPRVDAIKLHAWAQRLQRRFGWGRERFVVEGAQPSESKAS